MCVTRQDKASIIYLALPVCLAVGPKLGCRLESSGGEGVLEIQAAPLSMTSESRGGRLRDFQALRRVVMRNKVALCRALLKVLSLHRFIL